MRRPHLKSSVFLEETRKSVNLNIINSKQVPFKIEGSIKILTSSQTQMCLLLMTPFKWLGYHKRLPEMAQLNQISTEPLTHTRFCTVSKNVLWWVWASTVLVHLQHGPYTYGSGIISENEKRLSQSVWVLTWWEIVPHRKPSPMKLQYAAWTRQHNEARHGGAHL